MNKMHVDSVLKSYDNRQILSDVFMSCTKGEIIGLLGRNGIGKSTLLKIIFGSVRADNKFVKIDNKYIKGLYDNRNLLNYLPQNNFLPNHVKIKTIIKLFCDKKNASIIINNHLIKPLLDKKIKQLSGGEKRIIEIFLIVLSNAKYILIDEPFNGVAPVHKEEIKKLIIEQSENKGFIITDHDYRNILDIATRTVLIYDGGTKEIKNNEELIQYGYLR
ncbi:ATP-binding cassette domain-containing protein [Lutibacter flavus]|uniref:ABC-type lipopolysaccharide export system, ATPase component n=1 Tax=Lutibacter flavus TaxID=691689 RepID=A0A238VUE1_9FLAO|nr:ATP-binding cassette domain-containing protein [Lutibacter flavus]SNR37801.1 ABC-type lipopolysaccharide export system, ATPase component [Lutibacter flavus]